MDPRVQKTIRLMEEYLDREQSVQELARSVNLSTGRLSHLFKAATGVPPIQYLGRLRMERAKELLETTFLSVKEVKNRVGVNDDSHFVRDFKKRYGLRPVQHRAYHLGAQMSHQDVRGGMGMSDVN
jgi:transcriptional regulator GlxA family with amidase domain